MNHKNYERIREEVAKRYKDEIQDLKLKNINLANRLIETEKELNISQAKNAKLQYELDRLPDSVKAIIHLSSSGSIGMF